VPGAELPDGLAVGLPLGLADEVGVLLGLWSCRSASLITRPLFVAPSVALGLALGLTEPFGWADGDPLGLPLGFGVGWTAGPAG
jgi:hypothetical protein